MSKVKMSKDLIVKCRTKEEAVMLWNWYDKNGYVRKGFDCDGLRNFLSLYDNLSFYVNTNSPNMFWHFCKDELSDDFIVYASDIDFEDDIDNEPTKEPSKEIVHESLCNLIHETYVKKNADYGDSFGESIKDFGYIAGLVRISDKWNRIKNLLSGSEAQVNDESVKDTLLDMANYCIMLYMEIK